MPAREDKVYRFTPDQEDALAGVLHFAFSRLDGLPLAQQAKISEAIHKVIAATEDGKG